MKGCGNYACLAPYCGKAVILLILPSLISNINSVGLAGRQLKSGKKVLRRSTSQTACYLLFGAPNPTENCELHSLHNACFVGEALSLSEKQPGITKSSSLISGSLYSECNCQESHLLLGSSGLFSSFFPILRGMRTRSITAKCTFIINYMTKITKSMSLSHEYVKVTMYQLPFRSLAPASQTT